MTNEEKIKNMSTEELAAFLQSVAAAEETFDCSTFCDDYGFGCYFHCKHNKGADFVIDWLRDEA